MMIDVNVFLLSFLGGVLLLLMAGVFIQAARITELKACISKRSNEMSVAVMQIRHWRDTAESFQVDNRRLLAQLHEEQEYRVALANELLSVDIYYCGEKVDTRWLEARSDARLQRDKRRHSPSPMPTLGDLTFAQAIANGEARVPVTEGGVKSVPVESYKRMPEPVGTTPAAESDAVSRRHTTAVCDPVAPVDAYAPSYSSSSSDYGSSSSSSSSSDSGSSSSSSSYSCD